MECHEERLSGGRKTAVFCKADESKRRPRIDQVVDPMNDQGYGTAELIPKINEPRKPPPTRVGWRSPAPSFWI
jgi:hypothetical protein